MRRTRWLRALVVAGVAVLCRGPVGADDWQAPSELDVRALYERLSPGMSAHDVAALTGGQLGTAPRPVTSWLLWNSMPDGKGTAVLRASFQDGRIVRLEFESFGVEYRRLTKGADPGVEIAADELARIWRQAWRAERAAGACRDALDAYHRVVLGAQERLTFEEQRAWARALQLRQEAERHVLPGGP